MGPQLVFDLRLLESRLSAILELQDKLVTIEDVMVDIERVRNLTRAMIHGYEADQLPEDVDVPRFPFPA